MNKTITSKEAILSVGKEIVLEKGIQGLNIRDLAHKCGISIGSVYNYFPTKSDLIVDTVESIWKEIFADYQIDGAHQNFVDHVQSLFLTIQKGSELYPSFFFLHSISRPSFDKVKGRQSMERYFTHIKQGLLSHLDTDSKIKDTAFSNNFAKEDFIEFIFTHLVTLLMKESKSCDLLLEVIRRIIY